MVLGMLCAYPTVAAINIRYNRSRSTYNLRVTGQFLLHHVLTTGTSVYSGPCWTNSLVESASNQQPSTTRHIVDTCARTHTHF